jgi:hypothetical protein
LLHGKELRTQKDGLSQTLLMIATLANLQVHQN